MTVEEKIKAALFGRIATLELTPALPVVGLNEDFPGKNPGGAPRPKPASYLRVELLPNRNVRLVIKGTGPHLRRGILQVTFVGELNKGYDLATKATGAVAAHFPADLILTSDGVDVRIEAAPDIAGGMRDGDAWSVPVSIRYQAFA